MVRETKEIDDKSELDSADLEYYESRYSMSVTDSRKPYYDNSTTHNAVVVNVFYTED